MNRNRNIIDSFVIAFKGLKHAIAFNRNIRVHFFLGFLVIIFGLLLKVSTVEFEILAVTVLFVICTEMLNTAIEEVVNLLTSDYRVEAKIAKDVCAGMVFVASLGSFIVGLLVFIPHLLQILKIVR